MAVGSRLLNGRQLLVAAAKGLRIVLPAIAILTVAATLSRMTGNRSVDGKATQDAYEFSGHRLYTGEYLKSLISPDDADHQLGAVSKEPAFSNLSIKMLPTVVFVLASIVAFCTGTSWGTMGILMPMVVTLAHALLTRDGQTVSASNPIMLGSIGGVLAGAVFGDHCSPISDTTVLSSHASGCDHIAHVRTQLPYAPYRGNGGYRFRHTATRLGYLCLVPVAVTTRYARTAAACDRKKSIAGAGSLPDSHRPCAMTCR